MHARREPPHFGLYAGGLNSVPHVCSPCVCVCVRLLERVLCSVSCALIILPGVVAEQQIIHGPANQDERQVRFACTRYLRGNDLVCVHKFEPETTEWEETLRYVLATHANRCSSQMCVFCLGAALPHNVTEDSV